MKAPHFADLRFLNLVRALPFSMYSGANGTSMSTMGRKFGGEPGQCPVSERMADTLVRLPFFNEMTRDEQQRAIDAIRSFRG